MRHSMLWVLLAATFSSHADPLEISYPFRTVGSCPGECCLLGEWEALTDVPVFERDRGDDPPIATISPGETLLALRGVYWSITPAIVRTTKDVNLSSAIRAELRSAGEAVLGHEAGRPNTQLSVPSGTEIHVVAEDGMGTFLGVTADKQFVWVTSFDIAPLGGDMSQTSFEYVAPEQVPCSAVWGDMCRAMAYRTDNTTEWWAEVEFHGGNTGWIQVRPGRWVAGYDACS